jgi:preprotein translocase subunit SecG
VSRIVIGARTRLGRELQKSEDELEALLRLAVVLGVEACQRVADRVNLHWGRVAWRAPKPLPKGQALPKLLASAYTGKRLSDSMVILLTIIHVIVCLFLIMVVLLQSGKAADLAGAFGGMGSQTAFGPRGSATLLSKLTTAAAALFMITSLSLSIAATKRAGTGGSVLERTKAPAQTKQQKSAQPPGPTVQMQQEGQAPSKPIPIPMPPAEKSAPAEQPKK